MPEGCCIVSHVTNAAEFSRNTGDLPDIVALLRMRQYSPLCKDALHEPRHDIARATICRAERSSLRGQCSDSGREKVPSEANVSYVEGGSAADDQA